MFAYIYNTRWQGFARRVAPLILDFYEQSGGLGLGKEVLDLCCGTGQSAAYALTRGYSVLGIDASQHMLEHAAVNAPGAVFLHGLAQEFAVDRQYGLVVSLFDSLNHLASMDDLKKCFACAYKATKAGGYFIFDLNTGAGLKKWNSVLITDEDDLMIVNRGIFRQDDGKAYVKISGFSRLPNGLYERFEEDMFNTHFVLEEVSQGLTHAGFSGVYTAKVEALGVPLTDPESEGRVFFVARKP